MDLYNHMESRVEFRNKILANLSQKWQLTISLTAVQKHVSNYVDQFSQQTLQIEFDTDRVFRRREANKWKNRKKEKMKYYIQRTENS